MQPSYPLPEEEKRTLLEEALRAIARAAAEADRIVITHYHYDHFLAIPQLYEEKPIWLKDPNRWINRSQWVRAREFLAMLAKARGGSLAPQEPEGDPTLDEDPFERLEIAKAKDFGDYQRRRAELLARGRTRLEKLKRFWLKGPWVGEEGLRELGIEFADGRLFGFG
jgi:glyoxylase-like metal-dependent hydrolase (beta-lactamase superfamily II)